VPVDASHPVVVLDPTGASENSAGLVLLTRVPDGLDTSSPVMRFSVDTGQGPTVLVFDSPRRVAFGANVTIQETAGLVAQSGWVSDLVLGVVIPRATAATTTPPPRGRRRAPQSARRNRAARTPSRSQGAGGGGAGRAGAGGAAPFTAAVVAPALGAASPAAGKESGSAQERKRSNESPTNEAIRTVTRPVERLVEVIPPALRWLLGVLGAAALAFAAAAGVAAARGRRARRQGERLSRDKRLLEEAIGSKLPERTPGLAVSVAHRAAEGPGAGGDFYEVVALAGGRTAFVVGDVSGHDREAVVAATQVRKALRAYLLAGLEPRQVIQVATHAQVDQLGEHFATVTVAVYEPVERDLVYASAGHPPPLTTDGPLPTPRPVCPPIGVAVGAIVQQENVRLERGRAVLLHTDGLSEARSGNLGMLGRDGLSRLLREEPDAEALTDRVREIGGASDDMVACILVPGVDGPVSGTGRTEPLTVAE
jgi:Stage II sporulation protein E (SpoIIE)